MSRRRSIRSAICWGRPAAYVSYPVRFDLPASERGTLFLHDIAVLTPPQQMALYDWLSTRGREWQVVSMTGSQMLPLVETGRFLDRLFYRLNTISTVARSA